MDGRYFISYSRVDAAEFAQRIADELVAGPPSYPVWLDVRDERPAADWDTQAADRGTTLAELLAETGELPDNVVEVLVGEAFSRLDAPAQQVMQALAIYPVPVRPVAVDYLLQPYRPAVDAAPMLGRLVNMQFVRREAGRYYLHQVDRDYALSRLPVGAPADRDADPAPFTQQALRHRGAGYFEQIRTPREDWKTLDDLAPQLAEFELRCQGEDYGTAAQVLFGIGFGYLIQWGHYRLTADMHQRLQGRLDDPWADAGSKGDLGECYRSLGDFTRAIDLDEQALAIARETGNRWGEAINLGNLGNCHSVLGQFARAIELHEQALAIDRETGNRQGEANNLGNLSDRYHLLGQNPRAIELQEQALAINLGTGHRYGEALDLVRLGILQRDLGRWDQAAEYCRQAIEVADAIGSAQAQNVAHRVLAGIHLLAGDLPAARQAISAAGEHDYPPARADLSMLSGVIMLRLDQQEAAARAFRDAITQADALLRQTSGSFGVMNTKALALCGLALTVDPGSAAEAADVFRAARAITSADGIVRQVLTLFDVLAAADRSGVLAGIRPALAGPDG